MSLTRATSSSYSHPEREFRTVGHRDGDMFIGGILGVKMGLEEDIQSGSETHVEVVDLRHNEIAKDAGQTALHATDISAPNPEN